MIAEKLRRDIGLQIDQPQTEQPEQGVGFVISGTAPPPAAEKGRAAR